MEPCPPTCHRGHSLGFRNPAGAAGQPCTQESTPGTVVLCIPRAAFSVWGRQLALRPQFSDRSNKSLFSPFLVVGTDAITSNSLTCGTRNCNSQPFYREKNANIYMVILEKPPKPPTPSFSFPAQALTSSTCTPSPPFQTVEVCSGITSLHKGPLQHASPKYKDP